MTASMELRMCDLFMVHAVMKRPGGGAEEHQAEEK
jgi:hypothetical protein